MDAHRGCNAGGQKHSNDSSILSCVSMGRGPRVPGRRKQKMGKDKPTGGKAAAAAAAKEKAAVAAAKEKGVEM